jgi:heptaprenyl diphosphate synthase
VKLLDIYARKKRDIERIERALEQAIRSDHVMLNDASLHLLRAGGKRIRPVFVLLAGEFGHNDPVALTKVAVSLELIHMGSLVHDDVIDDAEIRRGESTVKAKWDNRIAMYTGDYIFAKALMVITDLENPLIHQQLSKAMVEMCIGEMEQIRMFFRTEQSVRDYLLRIRRKTALLIAASCHMGALASGVPFKQSRALYSFGYNVGMAFQIRDDILDLIGTEKELGKPPGSDIRQGNITLPVIYALQEPALRPRLLEQIAEIRAAEGSADIAEFLTLIRNSTGIARAEELVDRYIAKAIRSLEALPDNKARRNLKEIALFIGQRKF